MTRYLTILAVALAAVVAAAALTKSNAGAVEEETISAYYMASELGLEEIADIDGDQTGETTTAFTIGSLPSLTCSTIEYDGEAGDTGPISEEPVEIKPVYSTCHVIAPLLGTRTATVTMNGCTYDVAPTGTITESEVTHLIGDLDITCPEGEEMEVHVYNTSGSDSGASTLCTFAVPAQENLSGITLTNSETDIVADFNVGSIQVERTGGSEAFCGPASQTATYKGEATLRATDEDSEFLTVQAKATKIFALGQPNATVIGDEKGSAELTTEDKTKIVQCTTVKYEAFPVAKQVGTLTITPFYSNCSYGGMTADVDFKSCKYVHTLLPVLHQGPLTTASVEIDCQNGEKITITATNAKKEVKCTITYAKQKASGHVGLKNNEVIAKGDSKKWWVKFTSTLTALSYEITGEEALCGKNGSFKTGLLHGALDVRAYNDKMKSKQMGIRVFGNDTHSTDK